MKAKPPEKVKVSLFDTSRWFFKLLCKGHQGLLKISRGIAKSVNKIFWTNLLLGNLFRGVSDKVLD